MEVRASPPRGQTGQNHTQKNIAPHKPLCTRSSLVPSTLRNSWNLAGWCQAQTTRRAANFLPSRADKRSGEKIGMSVAQPPKTGCSSKRPHTPPKCFPRQSRSPKTCLHAKWWGHESRAHQRPGGHFAPEGFLFFGYPPSEWPFSRITWSPPSPRICCSFLGGLAPCMTPQAPGALSSKSSYLTEFGNPNARFVVSRRRGGHLTPPFFSTRTGKSQTRDRVITQ